MSTTPQVNHVYPQTVTVSAKIPEWQKSRLEALARSQRQTVSRLVAEALEHFLEGRSPMEDRIAVLEMRITALEQGNCP